jgi:hypothetical protein
MYILMNNIPVNNTHETATAPQHLCCRDGVYYFVRRVPSDVQKHYRATRVSMSLRTKSRAAAVRAAKRSGKYVVKALGNRDHLIESGLSMGSVKRIFRSVRSIINLVLREYGIEGSNA